MRNCIFSVGMFLLSVSTVKVPAWSGHEVTAGPVTLSIAPVKPVVDPSIPITVTAELINTGDTSAEGTVEARDFVDSWGCVSPAKHGVVIAPGDKISLNFDIAAESTAYNALYPVHLYAALTVAGKPVRLHAVRIFEVRHEPREPGTAKSQALPVNSLARDAALPLWLLGNHRVAWRYYQGDWRYKPVGWTGTDPVSRASAAIRTVNRGESRAALNMHPPWQPGGGTVVCDYKLKLPARTPVSLTFATAIRDHKESEPPSDGVLFRVHVANPEDPQKQKTAFERFSAAKRWEDARVDLTEWAGQTILLRLESNPGPARNTTCDSSYWAQPIVMARKTPPEISKPAPEAGQAEHVKTASQWSDSASGKGRIRFDLVDADAAPAAKASVLLGPRGMLDGNIVFVLPNGNSVHVAGLEVDIEYGPAGRWPSVHHLMDVAAKREGEKLRVDHLFSSGTEEYVLRVVCRPEGRALRIQTACPKRITRLTLGPWSSQASKVYYGHGYCIETPKAFRAGFGGHNLATSHVACDFDSGISVLQALNTPPRSLEVDPDPARYTLVGRMNSTLTLLPGKDAFECAVAYRPLYDKSPAPGVARLAGRFCFDIWGGRYEEIAENMEKMLGYGLTDSFLTVHNWQRWGYDYRLPDVWPPNPDNGTIGDMLRISRICARYDIPWGLHDNYIDFYPDAEDFSYRHIYFRRKGSPVKAWYNKGRDARAYKWRPDHILPFIKRNYSMIREAVAPTHSFLDVFTSSGCVEYWDYRGNFHSALETRRCWGEAFAWIRDFLGENAPTTSEAGHDQLIGYLDGADCQWLTLAPKGRKHVLAMTCADWERVPWYDAVNHRRFILHGAGYSGRYQGGRSRVAHGINSDDYISAEVLSGHALMTDASSWGRQAVRKYWLAQPVARRLAGRVINAVRFANDDIHRQHVSWNNGVDVYVNRGKKDWKIAGRVLPPFGFLVEDGDRSAALERRHGRIAESCSWNAWRYVNARTRGAENLRQLPIEPSVEKLTYDGGNAFRWTMRWQADAPAPRNDHIFVHFSAEGGAGAEEICFQDDHAPPVPPTEWTGTVSYDRTVELPEDARGQYRAYVGMYGKEGRALLRGTEVGHARYWVATLNVRRDKDGITGVTMDPAPELPPEIPPELNPPGTMVDFGFVKTDGAFRLVQRKDGVVLTPLPEQGPFRVKLSPAEIPPESREPSVASLPRLEEDNPKSVPSRRNTEGFLEFRVSDDARDYRIGW